LLRSPLPNHVADPLEFRYLGVEVVVECSALRCSWRAPPSRLLVVPMGLLVSVVAGRGSMDVCGWAVWDICVVWVVV
jgi:hypothetical protein